MINCSICTFPGGLEQREIPTLNQYCKSLPLSKNYVFYIVMKRRQLKNGRFTNDGAIKNLDQPMEEGAKYLIYQPMVQNIGNDNTEFLFDIDSRIHKKITFHRKVDFIDGLIELKKDPKIKKILA